MASTLFIEPCIDTKLFKKNLDTMQKMAKSAFSDFDKTSVDVEYAIPEFPVFYPPSIVTDFAFPENIGEQFLMPLQALAAGLVLAFEPLTLTLQSINDQLIIINDSALQSSSGIGEAFSAQANGVGIASIISIGADWKEFSNLAIPAISAFAESSGIAAGATGILGSLLKNKQFKTSFLEKIS